MVFSGYVEPDFDIPIIPQKSKDESKKIDPRELTIPKNETSLSLLIDDNFDIEGPILQALCFESSKETNYKFGIFSNRVKLITHKEKNSLEINSDIRSLSNAISIDYTSDTLITVDLDFGNPRMYLINIENFELLGAATSYFNCPFISHTAYGETQFLALLGCDYTGGRFVKVILFEIGKTDEKSVLLEENFFVSYFDEIEVLKMPDTNNRVYLVVIKNVLKQKLVFY